LGISGGSLGDFLGCPIRISMDVLGSLGSLVLLRPGELILSQPACQQSFKATTFVLPDLITFNSLVVLVLSILPALSFNLLQGCQHRVSHCSASRALKRFAATCASRSASRLREPAEALAIAKVLEIDRQYV